MPGYVDIQGELNANGEFALLDDGQCRGGFRAVNTIAERNAIIPDRRKNGMHVYVAEKATVYKLESDQWKIANIGIRSMPMSELDEYRGFDPVIVEDFLFETTYTETTVGGHPSLEVHKYLGQCIVFVSKNETFQTGRFTVTQTAVYGRKSAYRTTAYNAESGILLSDDWTQWKDIVTVSTAGGENLLIWIGDESELPEESERTGTGTLYIAL